MNLLVSPKWSPTEIRLNCCYTQAPNPYHSTSFSHDLETSLSVTTNILYSTVFILIFLQPYAALSTSNALTTQNLLHILGQ